jgi:hypothetical protein
LDLRDVSHDSPENLRQRATDALAQFDMRQLSRWLLGERIADMKEDLQKHQLLWFPK